jgi:alkane 1-monooxygenase
MKTEESDDMKNLSSKSERNFFNDKRFWIPLYLFNFLETLSWIFQLILMSDVIHKDSYFYFLKPKTWPQYYIFTFLFGFFAGLNAVAGHELLHKREFYNKMIGTWAYSKFMYSHFLDEHTKGHHKYLGTSEDPATARKNETVYEFVLRSVVNSHINCWNREVKRIKKELGNDIPKTLIFFNNKMVMYFILHISILACIAFFLGANALKYQFCYTFWGIWYLELINYIEHYGIIRE